MKKFIATMAALAVMTAAFTGCTSSNTDSSNSSSNTDSSSSSSSAAESGATSEGSSDASTPEADRTAQDITNAVFESVDWVSSEQVTDAEIAETMLGLDLSELDDYSIFVPLMSVHLDELIVVKPKAGSESKVEEELTAHLDYIKDGAAFYPDQEIAAAGAVMGQTDDGFYYLVVHQIGSEIAEVIKNYKPGDEITKLEVPEPDYGDDGVTVVPTDELGDPVYGSDVDINAPAVMPGDMPVADGTADGAVVF